MSFQLVDQTASAADVAAGRAPIGGQILPYPDNPLGAKAIAVQRRAIITGDQLIDAKQGYDQNNLRDRAASRFNSDGAPLLRAR